MSRKVGAWGLVLLCLAVAPAIAQKAAGQSTIRSASNGGTVSGVVKDPSGAVIPGAGVTLTDENGSVRQIKTGPDGAYTFRAVPPGAYSVSVTFPGLSQSGGVAVSVDTGQVARGDVAMKPAEVKQEVTVAEENTSQLGLQSSQNADALVFKGADLAALPDDPDDLQQDLQALAGPSAGPNGGEIFIDGFSSGRLPPKESIREIRINQNPFSGEYDKLGFGRIEIFTKPGSDKFHGTASYDISDGIWNARNPFVLTDPVPGFRAQTYGGNVSGPIYGHASFFLDVERRQINDNAILTAINPQTLLSDNGTTPTPQQRTTVSPRVDWQLGANNTLSVRYSYLDVNRNLWGVGLFNLPGSGYGYVQGQDVVQVTETAVISNKVVNESRLQFNHSTTNENAQTGFPCLAQSLNGQCAQVTVPGAFVQGSAGVGHTTQLDNNYEFQNYTTLTHGTHTIKFGARGRQDLLHYYTPSNFNGTFTFSTLAGYTAQMPTLFTINNTANGGAPTVSASMFDLGAYVQDDWRVSTRLTLSYGLRWEGQTNIHDWHDAAPRFSFAWAPAKTGKRGTPSTVIRGGVGMFYIRFPDMDQLSIHQYENQVSYTVSNPTFYPVIPANFFSIQTPSSQVHFITDSNLRAPYLIQSAIGVERQINRQTTLAVNVTDTRGVHQFVTNQVSPPGSATGETFAFQSDGLLKQLQVITRVNSQIGRMSLFGAYIWSTAHSNTDGLLCASVYGCGTSTPVNPYNLTEEWGRAALAVEHRMFLAGTLQGPKRIQLSPFITAGSGVPFNITTGGELNGILNERPVFAGPCPVLTASCFNPNPLPGETLIPRNYGTGPTQFTVNMRLSRTWGFGPTKFAGSSGGARANAGGGGPRGGGGPMGGFGGGRGGFGGGSTEHRYNLTLSLSARNLLNHVNYTAPVGIIGSPLFLQYTSISGGYGAEATPTDNRRLDLQLRFQF